MRTVFSLVWKEYREQRWFLIAALAIFCGFPLIEATGRYMRPPTPPPGYPASTPEFYSDSAVAIVLGLGGVLAIFVAIGSTTRDLRDELHVFWRSRPVGVGRWMGIKYFAGLFTVLMACTIPLLMQFWMAAGSGRHWSVTEVAGAVGIHSFAVILIFSVAFLLGCLVRHATHAALLALAAALVIYFLPVVVEPLARLSVFNLMNDEAFTLERSRTPNPAGWNIDFPGSWRVMIEPIKWTVFAAAMLGGSIAAAVLALETVRRDWRIEADRRAMHWSLGGVAMLMFGATAFQVGSNLKVNRQFDLPLPHNDISGFAFDGSRGVMMLRDANSQQYYGQVRVKLCSVDMTGGAPTFGRVVSPSDAMNVPYAWHGEILFRLGQRPDRAYLLAEESGYLPQPVNGRSYEIKSLKLLTIDLTAAASADPVVHRLDLLPPLADAQMPARAFQLGDRLYVAGGMNLLEIDLASDPPRVDAQIDLSVPVGTGWARSSALYQHYSHSYDAAGNEIMDVPLLPLPGRTPRERLCARVELATTNSQQVVHGDLLVVADAESVRVFRLTSIDDKVAHFLLAGRREHTPLERLVGSYPSALHVIDDKVYVQETRMGVGVSVYDMRDPTRPRSVGHFAVPKASRLAPCRLANGELMIAADRFYVMMPPPDAVE